MPRCICYYRTPPKLSDMAYRALGELRASDAAELLLDYVDAAPLGNPGDPQELPAVRALVAIEEEPPLQGLGGGR